jgi:hypothetical protein
MLPNHAPLFTAVLSGCVRTHRHAANEKPVYVHLLGGKKKKEKKKEEKKWKRGCRQATADHRSYRR